jgi:Zn-dependent M28 family amino/carboxypeptidase
MLTWMTAGALAADPVVARLVEQSLASEEPWAELVELCDDIGPRLAGSRNLDRAIRWARKKMLDDGLAVELQPVDVPHWVRGPESAAILAPVAEPLDVLGLGGSVPTPEGGLEAQVVVARDWDELEALGTSVKGRIVVYDAPWQGYGDTVGYRWAGADRAAKLGAVGVLVRSVTDTELALPHTGAMGYGAEDGRIPAAAITPEAASRFRRWTDRQRTVSVRLSLQSETKAPAASANVVGDVRGATKPDEVVLLSCHLDSWDVGTGAQDDGAACVAVMEAVAQIAALDVKPARTVRAVLFTNEENGLAGGKAYPLSNTDLKHVAAIESDTGMGGTLGFRVDGRKHTGEATVAGWFPFVQGLLEPLSAHGVTTVETGYSGADIGPLLDAQGGLGLGVAHDMSGYWAIHHTEADTIDKIDPADLRTEVALLAATAWQLANADAVPGARPKPPQGAE